MVSMDVFCTQCNSPLIDDPYNLWVSPYGPVQEDGSMNIIGWRFKHSFCGRRCFEAYNTTYDCVIDPYSGEPIEVFRKQQGSSND